MKAEDGTWRGISIDLWRRIANQIHLRYRFQETTLKGLTDGVAEGSLDAAVAALTVTGPRLRMVDFTQPFYSAGLGVAVASDAGITWWPIIRNVFSLGFFALPQCYSPSRFLLASSSGSSSTVTTSILAPIGEVWEQVFGGRRRR